MKNKSHTNSIKAIMNIIVHNLGGGNMTTIITLEIPPNQPYKIIIEIQKMHPVH